MAKAVTFFLPILLTAQDAAKYDAPDQPIKVKLAAPADGCELRDRIRLLWAAYEFTKIRRPTNAVNPKSDAPTFLYDQRYLYSLVFHMSRLFKMCLESLISVLYFSTLML